MVDSGYEPVPEGPAVDTGFNFVQEGLDRSGLMELSVRSVAAGFDEAYRRKMLDKKTGNTKKSYALALNANVRVDGAMYALASRWHGNVSWREHVAESIRGILYPWGNKTAMMHQEVHGGANVRECENCKAMSFFYGYFSAVVHQDGASILQIRKDLGDKYSRPGSDTDDDFVEQVQKFFLTANRLFRKETAS